MPNAAADERNRGDPVAISGQEDTAAPVRDHDRRRYVCICAGIIALCIALKLPTLFFDRHEYDEQIYWELTRNWMDTGSYTLRGSAILNELPPQVYDRPLFHHPPLFAILLAPFVAMDSIRAAILVPWLGHVLAVCGVALACWAWRRRSWNATHIALWLPVLAVALDPLLTFCSRKLWLDDLVGGLAGLAMGLLVFAAARLRTAWAVAGGAALGLAALTKLPALILLPAAALLLWYAGSVNLRTRRRLLLAAALPAAILIVPWFVLFFVEYQAFLPDWIHPDRAMIDTSGLVRRAVSRPWHYYIAESLLVAPVSLIVLVAYFIRRRHIRSVTLGVPCLWVALVIVVLTGLGLSGQGMQLRFLTIASPGLYVMLAALLTRANPRRPVLAVAALLAVLYGAIYSGFFLLNGIPDEIQSVPQYLWQRWQAAQ